jgi:hypothetical protein
MSTSRYIARLMGPLLLVLGLGMAFGIWAQPAAYLGMMKQFTATPSFIFVMGMLALVAGLAIVNAHNLWVPDWRVIITILGWLAVIRGVVSLLFPLRLHAVGQRIVESSSFPIIGAVITIVLGAFLAIKGYERLEEPKHTGQAKSASASASAPAKGSARKSRNRAKKTGS